MNAQASLYYSERRTYPQAVIYWTRLWLRKPKNINKVLWWLRFALIVAVPEELLVNALTFFPIVGTVLIPVDIIEAVPEGAGFVLFVWCFVKALLNSRALLPTCREIRAMRDRQYYRDL